MRVLRIHDVQQLRGHHQLLGLQELHATHGRSRFVLSRRDRHWTRHRFGGSLHPGNLHAKSGRARQNDHPRQKVATSTAGGPSSHWETNVHSAHPEL